MDGDPGSRATLERSLAAARGGDLDAFEALARPTLAPAWRVALALVGPSLATGVVGDAWQAAWHALPARRRVAAPEAWLLGIVVARSRARLRRPGAIREIPVAGIHGPGLAHGAGSAGPATDTLGDAAAAFAALRFDERAVLVLEAAGGLEPAGLAVALGRRPGAVTRERRRAREALVRRLGGDAGVESQVQAFLGALGNVPVPPSLATDAMAGVRARPGRRQPVRLALLAAAAGLLAVLALVLAAGWDPPIDVVPGPATPPPATPATTSGPFRPADAWSFAEVLRPGGEVRTEPGGGTAIRNVTADDVGRRVLVLGRQHVSGREWVKLEWPVGLDDAAFVWTPSGVTAPGAGGFDLPVLGPAEPSCPEVDAPSVELVALMPLPDRLACIGTTPVTIGPVWIEAVSPGPGDGTPAWLAAPADRAVMSALGTGRAFRIAPLRVDPALGAAPPVKTWLRLRVHLDDPAASGCRRAVAGLDAPVGTPADQELWCRQQAVVTGWTEVPGRRSPASP